MTNAEIKQKLTEAFQSHTVMKGREQHTVNELLYVLEHDDRFANGNFNISIKTLSGRFWCIPCMDAFVTVQFRSVWFNDADVEFETDECEGQRFDNITVYETERSD